MLSVITTEIDGLKHGSDGIVIPSFPLSNRIDSVDQKLIAIVSSFPESIIIETIFFLAHKRQFS